MINSAVERRFPTEEPHVVVGDHAVEEIPFSDIRRDVHRSEIDVPGDELQVAAVAHALREERSLSGEREPVELRVRCARRGNNTSEPMETEE